RPAKSGSEVRNTPSHRAPGADVQDNPRSKGSAPRASRARAGQPPMRPSPNADGLKTRDVAVSALYTVWIERRPFEEAFSRAAAARDLAPRDRAFARLIATTALRHRGSLQAVLSTYLAKPLPERMGRLDEILLAAVAQLLLLQTPPHAAISLAV